MNEKPRYQLILHRLPIATAILMCLFVGALMLWGMSLQVIVIAGLFSLGTTAGFLINSWEGCIVACRNVTAILVFLVFLWLTFGLPFP